MNKIKKRVIVYLIINSVCCLIYYLLPILNNYQYVADLGHLEFFNYCNYLLPFILILTILYFTMATVPYFKTKLSNKFWKLQYLIGIFKTLIMAFIVSVSCFLLLVGMDAPVHGSSMEPTLTTTEKVFIKYQKQYQRFDVIAFHKIDGSYRKYYVKRIIGVEGDQITWINQQLIINGEVIKENYLGMFTDSEDFLGTFTYIKNGEKHKTMIIPKGYVFVLGDNRAVGASLDSRNSEFGLVETKCIIGKIAFHIKNLEKIS